jgi:hypothetical protein
MEVKDFRYEPKYGEYSTSRTYAYRDPIYPDFPHPASYDPIVAAPSPSRAWLGALVLFFFFFFFTTIIVLLIVFIPSSTPPHNSV